MRSMGSVRTSEPAPKAVVTASSARSAAPTVNATLPALDAPDASRKSLVAIGICVYRVGPPYGTAISRFKALTTLSAGASKPIRVGGYSGVSFHAAVHGEHSLLPGIKPLIDLLPGGQQIFLNVRRKAVLLLIEISPRTHGEAVVRGLLRTMRFPP